LLFIFTVILNVFTKIQKTLILFCIPHSAPFFGIARKKHQLSPDNQTDERTEQARYCYNRKNQSGVVDHGVCQWVARWAAFNNPAY
jgi:hypothetical protein